MMRLDEIFRRCENVASWYGIEITSVNQRNNLDDTVIHTVCTWGDFEGVTVLIENGADVNARGDSGAVPLFNAVMSGNVDVVRLLLNNGADASVENDYGRLVLQYAKNVGASSEILRLLGGIKTGG